MGMSNSSCEILPPTFRGKKMPDFVVWATKNATQGKGLLELTYANGFTLSDRFVGLESSEFN